MTIDLNTTSIAAYLAVGAIGIIGFFLKRELDKNSQTISSLSSNVSTLVMQGKLSEQTIEMMKKDQETLKTIPLKWAQIEVSFAQFVEQMREISEMKNRLRDVEKATETQWVRIDKQDAVGREIIEMQDGMYMRTQRLYKLLTTLKMAVMSNDVSKLQLEDWTIEK